MSANTWYVISLVGYFATIVGLIVTVVLYFKLNILDVLGDLTGRTVAKEIKSMRENRSAKGNTRRPGKVYGTSKSAKVSGNKPGVQTSAGKTSGKTGGSGVAAAGNAGRRAKHGTAEMGGAVRTVQPDKRVLHSKTDRLSKDTEELYEDFDPRVEYSRTDILEDSQTQKKAGGTAILRSGTEILTEDETAEKSKTVRRATEVLAAKETAVLENGTQLLDESAPSGATTLLVEEIQIEPVKFSITRSYLVVHSEEKIL